MIYCSAVIGGQLVSRYCSPEIQPVDRVSACIRCCCWCCINSIGISINRCHTCTWMSIQVCNVAAECFLSWQAPQQATYSDDAPDCAFLLIPSKFPSALHLHLLLLFMYPHQHAYWSLDPSQLLLRKPGCMGCQLLMFILLGSHKVASCMATGFFACQGLWTKALFSKLFSSALQVWKSNVPVLAK